MPDPNRPHDHRPIWVTGCVRATCRDHFWQPVGITAASAAKADVR